MSSRSGHLKARAGQAQKVTFSVSDAGAAVSGAKVQVGKAHAKTNGKGKLTLMLGTFRRHGHLTAGVSAPGYTGASLSLAVR